MVEIQVLKKIDSVVKVFPNGRTRDLPVIVCSALPYPVLQYCDPAGSVQQQHPYGFSLQQWKKTLASRKPSLWLYLAVDAYLAPADAPSTCSGLKTLWERRSLAKSTPEKPLKAGFHLRQSSTVVPPRHLWIPEAISNPQAPSTHFPRHHDICAQAIAYHNYLCGTRCHTVVREVLEDIRPTKWLPSLRMLAQDRNAKFSL